MQHEHLYFLEIHNNHILISFPADIRNSITALGASLCCVFFAHVDDIFPFPQSCFNQAFP